MSNPFIGEIRMFTGNFPPLGWAFCNGQTLPINQYQALFSILGITYGGNGTSTFCLPNLQGRAPIHFGQGAGLSNYTLGEATGSETVALTTANLPAHTHAFNASSGGGTQASPSGGVPAVESTGTSQNYSTNAPDVTMSSQAVAATGNGTAVSVIQPVLAVNFIIALEGIYPSRS